SRLAARSPALDGAKVAVAVSDWPAVSVAGSGAEAIEKSLSPAPEIPIETTEIVRSIEGFEIVTARETGASSGFDPNSTASGAIATPAVAGGVSSVERKL